jgi:hypothetical protein
MVFSGGSMGKVDVLQAISDSFGLIRAHYREVALPLIVLLVLSGAGSFGGSSFSNSFGNRYSDKYSSSDNPLSNAMTGLDTSLLALGGILIAIIVAIVVLAIVLSILERAVWFYVYEHFYSLLTKKKISQDWKSRMERHSIKATALWLFWLLVFLAIFALPALQLWGSISVLSGASGLSGLWNALAPFLLLLFAAIGLLLLVGFLLSPLWIFYAMDGLGFGESLSRAAGLVMGNVWTFFIFSFIFFFLGIGGSIVAFASCCLAYIVSPVISVFLGLLWGVSLMKVKLALEK